MPQTLLAVLALISLTTFSLSMNARKAHLQHNTLVREVHEMASSTAVEMLEIIQAREYDKAVVLAPTTVITDANLFAFSGNADDHFTNTSACGLTPALLNGCEALEDFHGRSGIRAFELGMETVQFNVSVKVEYVEMVGGAFQKADHRTFQKQVIVSVQDVWPGDGKMLPVPIELRRTLSHQF